MNLSAAEKLANNGPYKSVKDIYKIKNLTGKACFIFYSFPSPLDLLSFSQLILAHHPINLDREKEMFREYENYFTVDKSFYQDRQMSS